MSCALDPKCMPEFRYLVWLLHPAVAPYTNQWDNVRKPPTNSEQQIAKRAQHSRYDSTNCATFCVLQLVNLHLEEDCLIILSTATRTSMVQYSRMNVLTHNVLFDILCGRRFEGLLKDKSRSALPRCTGYSRGCTSYHWAMPVGKGTHRAYLDT